VIASGRVSVTVNGEEVRELGPGGWFGEIALLHDVPRTATVTAVTDLALWTLDRESFLSSVSAGSTSLELAESHIRETYR
jgi:CRP-like cAMP-binding protein